VLGIDEAGRVPLAGPVVAAAVCLSNAQNVRLVEGVVDSKLIGLESTRVSLQPRYWAIVRRNLMGVGDSIVYNLQYMILVLHY
jgi:ribonuclease HII